MKEKIVISEAGLIKKFFKKSEISEVLPLDRKFLDKKKIIVFTPVDHIEKLTTEMSKAGAGNIGNYTMCSFRSEGIGTYLPNQKANPYKGKRGSLSYEPEIRLEMECEPKDLNKVLDAVMENHPYEEVVYEIYNIQIRDNKSNGSLVVLKNKIKYNVLLSKVNKKLDTSEIKNNSSFKKVAFIENDFDESFVNTCKGNGIDVILSGIENKINLIIL